MGCQNKTTNPISPGTDFVTAPIFLGQLGGPGAGNGECGQVGGLTLDGSGDIYVCDVANNRVEKFDPNGNFLKSIGTPGSGPGQLNGPLAVACLGASIYVLDSGNNRVSSFDTIGESGGNWGATSGVSMLNHPQGIALDGFGQIYVTDTANNRVAIFGPSDMSGPNTLFGSTGSGNGNFNFPTGITVDSGNNIYVSDTLNNRIEKFGLVSSNYTYTSQWGALGDNPGQFRSPNGLTFDDGGKIYVADSANGRVQVFDPTTNPPTFLSQFGGQGGNLAQFQVPIGIGVTPSPKYFYIADTGTAFVKKFGPPAPYTIFPNPVLPGDILTIAFNSASFIGYSIQIIDFNNNTVFNDQGHAVAGANAVQWNMSSNGTRVSAGVYLLSFTLGHSTVNEKISVAN